MYVRELGPHGVAAARGTIVYVHGLGESGLGFEKLMVEPRLAAWRQLAADLPGYGKSPWRAEPLGLEDHAACLAEWARAEIPEGAVVVGHSMGGVIGVLLCERLAEWARGFVNVEGNLSLADCIFSSKVAAVSRDELRAGALDRIGDEIYRRGRDDEALRTYYPSIRMCDPRAYQLNGVELVELSRSEGLAARMAALAVPRLYVAGVPRGAGERSRGLLDRAGVAWRAVEEAGHWPFLDRPAAFVDVMTSFLERL